MPAVRTAASIARMAVETRTRARLATDASFGEGVVVLVAGTAWTGQRLSDQSLAAELARHVPVLYVDPPASLARARRRSTARETIRASGVCTVAPNLVRVTPVVPGGNERLGGHQLTSALMRHAIHRAVDRLDAPIRAVIAVPPRRPLLDAIGADGAGGLRVHWAKDDYVASASLVGVSRRRLARNERRMGRRADVVVAASPTLRDHWQDRARGTVFIPNGVQDELFARTPSTAPARDALGLPRPVAGFIGQVSHRIDIELLDALAAGGVSVLLVGPPHLTLDRKKLEPLLTRPNVRWLPGRPFDALPAYLAAVDVGIVPYDAGSPFNHASFPLKMLEYIAAGRPVVSADLPAARWLATRHVVIAGGRDDFVTAVRDVAPTVDDRAARAERRALAAEHSWQRRADHWIGLLAGFRAST